MRVTAVARRVSELLRQLCELFFRIFFPLAKVPKIEEIERCDAAV